MCDIGSSVEVVGVTSHNDALSERIHYVSIALLRVTARVRALCWVSDVN
jgi:hypothetical protein